MFSCYLLVVLFTGRRGLTEGDVDGSVVFDVVVDFVLDFVGGIVDDFAGDFRHDAFNAWAQEHSCAGLDVVEFFGHCFDGVFLHGVNGVQSSNFSYG